MANKSIDITKIVAKLKTITEITNITGNRIYFGEPGNEATGIYITINLVSQTPTEYDKTARIEFRFLAHDTTVPKQQLIDLQDIVVQKLCYDSCLGIKDFSGFRVYRVIEGGTLVAFVDDKFRNLVIKDFILSFTQND